MLIGFNTDSKRKITEANINYYGKPFVHPKRILKEHDFIYLLDGEWKIGQNSKNYHLKKDTLLILSANQMHYGISHCLPNTKTMYFHVTDDERDCFGATNKKECDCLIESFFNAYNNGNIKKIFHGIVTSKLSGNERKAAILFDLLLEELSQSKLNSNDGFFVEKIVEIIHQNPENFFSNKELAKFVNVSVKTAETKFKKTYNTTIHQYMLNYKIEQAISYFKIFPEMPIKNIASNLGFYDEYHFSKQFKKITGHSPISYKNNVM